MTTVPKERHEKAAIIGFWRCGATVREIAAISGQPTMYVYQTIGDYLDLIGVENHEAEIN